MRLSFLLSVVFMGFCAVMAPVSAGAFDSAQAYIEVETLPPGLLPPPPAEGSKDWQKQIDAVLRAQRNLSSADLAAMKDEQNVRLDQMTSILGTDFTHEKLPKTFMLLDRVMSDTGKVIGADKKFWHTRRPYLTDARVKLLVDPIDSNPSYPSGHTTESRVLAEILGILVPEKRAALRARADAIALRRVEAGVHYPVDLDGGRMLAMLVVGSLTANDDFQDDLVLAKKEIAGKQ